MIMAKWKIKKEVNLDKEEKSSIHPVVLKLLFQRGIENGEQINNFLFPDYEKGLHDPFLFSQMEKAVKRVEEAREKGESVIIFGDYDADGVTASAILKEALNDFGIPSDVYIPDRQNEGYGMNLKAVEEFKKQNINLIITVDCGISNAEEIEKAKEYGIDVIVVDHHHVPLKVPQPFAIINPQMKDSGYPREMLAGVGVTFKFIKALYGKLCPQKEEQLKWLLDLVAIGTVADCVPLIGENRTMVKYGLVVLAKTRRAGLREIFNVGRILIDENNFPDSQKISFQIAPRINAAGRMDHANVAYNLIMAKDQVKARTLALELESNNQRRQKITNKIVEEVRIVANAMFKDKKLIFALEEHFPIGVAGLIAGKIAEEFNKPTMILQKGNEYSQGSLRSIPYVNIIEAVEKCGELLIKYGGHSQAAGIKIANENLEKFYAKLNSIIEKELEGKDITPEIGIDLEIFPKDVDFRLAEMLKKMEPFGEGNREPVFLMKNLIINELKLVGNGEKHLKLFLRCQDGSPKIFEAIGFRLGGKVSEFKTGDSVDAVFNLQQDEWNGNKKIQLKLVDFKLSS